MVGGGGGLDEAVEGWWGALAAEVFVGVKEWRQRHPTATFVEIERRRRVLLGAAVTPHEGRLRLACDAPLADPPGTLQSYSNAALVQQHPSRRRYTADVTSRAARSGVHLGTQGWSYDGWSGLVYPPGTPSGDRLTHYAGLLSLVEIDSTYYATPPADRVRRWAAQTPDDFVLAPKVPKQVTQEGKLAEDTLPVLGHFLSTMALQHALEELPSLGGGDLQIGQSLFRSPGTGTGTAARRGASACTLLTGGTSRCTGGMASARAAQRPQRVLDATLAQRVVARAWRGRGHCATLAAGPP